MKNKAGQWKISRGPGGIFCGLVRFIAKTTEAGGPLVTAVDNNTVLVSSSRRACA
jgi:hypothetical protein